MTFLVDAQLPPDLVRWLATKGYAAEHVDELGLRDADDITIWDRAVTTDAIVVTKDEDFAERTKRTETGPIIIWLRIGNAINRNLVTWLERRWPEIIELLEAGHRLIEVR